MAVAVQEATTSVDFVTEAVVLNHQARVEPSVEMTLAELVETPKELGAVRAVVASHAHTVEVVLDAESPIHALAEVAWGLDSENLHLNVLVSLDRLGEAHGELRGTPCTLQGWWFEDESVHFTGYERP
ncbi:MAG: hypothetical protein ACR2N7_06280 [Acidimicrobiia bacterium]